MACNSITLCVGVPIKTDKCDRYTVERKTSNFSNIVSGIAPDCLDPIPTIPTDREDLTLTSGNFFHY